VIGTILGDGCLERNGRNTRLKIDHSWDQEAFVRWKFRELQELDPSEPRLVVREDPRTRQIHRNLRFSTRTTPLLNSYHSFFYPEEGMKLIPPHILDTLISPLSLAVWYMDDGGRRSDCRSGYLNTNAYTPDDVEILKSCLDVRFGISTRTHFAAGKPRIYIPSGQFAGFCELVRPHVIPEMAYKLL
jgi:hypothetical protein